MGPRVILAHLPLFSRMQCTIVDNDFSYFWAYYHSIIVAFIYLLSMVQSVPFVPYYRLGQQAVVHFIERFLLSVQSNQEVALVLF